MIYLYLYLVLNTILFSNILIVIEPEERGSLDLFILFLIATPVYPLFLRDCYMNSSNLIEEITLTKIEVDYFKEKIKYKRYYNKEVKSHLPDFL